MTLEALVVQARQRLETEDALDRELLLAMDTARGNSLCFLSELELEVLANLGPRGVTECAPGSRLCTTSDCDPHPAVVVRSREVQLESLRQQRAPEVVLAQLESELAELQSAPPGDFDWSCLRRYPDDAQLFPAFEHELRWMRAAALLLVSNAAADDVVIASRLEAELAGAAAFLVRGPPTRGDQPSASHFIECALDSLSQTDQRTDQDLMSEIAVAAIVATTHVDPRSAWSQFLELWWATWVAVSV